MISQCLQCNLCIRQQVYNEQWGMLEFTCNCSIGELCRQVDTCQKYIAGDPKIRMIDNVMMNRLKTERRI